MNNTETIEGVTGEWRTVTKASEVTVGQRVRYTCNDGLKYGYTKGSTPNRFMATELMTTGYTQIFGTCSCQNIQAFFPLANKPKRKVAKVTVSQKYASSLIQICGVINGVKFYNNYKSRKSALRGAQRFCKVIGWEMEVEK